MQEKVLVTWENIVDVARRVVEEARNHFGERLLSFSDRYLQDTIWPWMDTYVREHYLLPGSPSKADLDDYISMEMNGGIL